jgi:hypothetical protein
MTEFAYYRERFTTEHGGTEKDPTVPRGSEVAYSYGNAMVSSRIGLAEIEMDAPGTSVSVPATSR